MRLPWGQHHEPAGNVMMMRAIVPVHAHAVLLVFFFQAEDGIRDVAVTGVQTCALPISDVDIASARTIPVMAMSTSASVSPRSIAFWRTSAAVASSLTRRARRKPGAPSGEIGRASCRERVEISVVAGSLKKKKRVECTRR